MICTTKTLPDNSEHVDTCPNYLDLHKATGNLCIRSQMSFSTSQMQENMLLTIPPSWQHVHLELTEMQ